MSILKRIEKSQQPSKAPSPRDAYLDLKNRIQDRMIAELDPTMDISSTDEVRRTIEEMYDTILAEESIILSRSERQRLFEQVVAEILGYGPIESLLADETVTGIMVNGPRSIYIERKGRLEMVNMSFESDDHLMRIIDRIAAPLGRRIDESSPYVDARLPDGSRVNAIIPPLALDGPTLTIRKFSKVPLTIENLIEFGTITGQGVEFLRACVKARKRIIVCGTAGSGKTTFLGLLASLVPDEERVVIVDDSNHELPLSNMHFQRLPENPTEYPWELGLTVYERLCIAANIRNARLILPEVEHSQFWSPDVLDVLAKTSYMTEIYGRSARSALLCLASFCLHRGAQWSPRQAFQTLTDSLDLIVCLARLGDGRRKVISIDAVPRSSDASLTTQPLFIFQRNRRGGGKVSGELQPVGDRPTEFLARLSFAQIRYWSMGE